MPLVSGATSVLLAPDARHVAVVDQGVVRSIEVATGRSAVLASEGAGMIVGPDGDAGARTAGTDRFTWSPDGRWVSFIQCAAPPTSCVARIAAADGSSHGYVPFAGPDPVGLADIPAWWWLPGDGRLVVRDPSSADWFVAEADGSGVEPAGRMIPVERSPQPDGHAEQQGDTAVLRMPTQTGSTDVRFPGMEVLHDEPASNGAWLVITRSLASPSWSTAGELWRVAPDGARADLAVAAATDPPVLVWDPTRTRVLVAVTPDPVDRGEPRWALVDMRFGGAPADAVQYAGAMRLVAWSPDGDRFVSDAGDGSGRLRITTIDGLERRRLDLPDAGLTAVAWVAATAP